ncbi:MAG: septum formation initiator family protein [Elusimicrobiaceae bacterium]|nr:septum formation initiator family protein [Elusimicrobiaceae bacterium]
MMKIFNSKRNILLIILTVIIAILVINDSFFALLHNSLKMRKLNEKITSLDAEYEELKKEYDKILSGDRSFLEEEARVNYNMAREGEIEFRIKK